MRVREQHGERNVRRRWGPGIVGLVILALVGVGVVVMVRTRATHDPAAQAATADVAVPVVARDATNTGVPQGVTLTASDGFTVRRDGTVIDGLDVHGCIDVEAKRVTIRNSRITCDGDFVIRTDRGSGTRIEDVTINGLGSGRPIAVYGDDYVVLRANISGVGDGPRMGSNTVIQDSYIHDLVTTDDNHSDGIQSTGGSNLVIRGNTIDHPHAGNATIMLTPTLGPLQNVLVAGNRLNGGAFTVRAGGDPGEASVTNVVFRNNCFGRDALYGIHAFGAGDVGWSANVWCDSGVTVS